MREVFAHHVCELFYECWRLRASRVVRCPKPVDDYGRLVADDPRVVAFRQRCDIAGAGNELRPVIHADGESSRDVILEMRGFATGGFRDRAHVGRPSPPGLKYQPPYL